MQAVRVLIATTPLEGLNALTPLADAGVTSAAPHAVVILAQDTPGLPAFAFDLLPQNPLSPLTAVSLIAARAAVPAQWRERQLPAGAPRYRIALVGAATGTLDAVAHAARSHTGRDASPRLQLGIADCRHAAALLAAELAGVSLTDAMAALARAAAGSRES